MQKAHGDRLVSVVLYGSAAAGDHQAKFSDLNILCVLSEITPRELAPARTSSAGGARKATPRRWLLTEHELATSTDCFAIEFSDMKRHHRLLLGKDVISPLVVDHSFYRAQGSTICGPSGCACARRLRACSPIPNCCAG